MVSSGIWYYTSFSHIKGSYHYVGIGVRDGVYDIDVPNISWMPGVTHKNTGIAVWSFEMRGIWSDGGG